MSYPQPLHWWTDNVLPLVYEESLSYYEVMSKIITYINGITQDTVELRTLVTELNTIIENADLDDIPEILERMDEIDTALGVIRGDVNTLKTDNTQNKADIANLKTDNTQNKADIANLKTDNTQNKADIANLKTDNTQNKADIADLKTDNTQNKGDIATLKTDNTQNKNAINDLNESIFEWAPVNLEVSFSQGGISPTTGGNSTSSKYARSGWFNALTAAYKVEPLNGCKIWAFYYNSPDVNSYANIVDEFTDTTVLKEGYYVRLGIGNGEDTAFTPQEALRSFIAYEYSKIKDEDDMLDAICNNEAEAIKYAIGSNAAFINATTGAATTGNGYSRTDFVDISNFAYLIFSNTHYDTATTVFGTAFYSDMNTSSYISGVCADILANAVSYETKVIKIPDGAKYARFTALQSLDGFFIKGVRKKPLSGLYLSILGDSMSAGDSNNPGGAMRTSAGGLYVPTGNAIYYNGTLGGVTNINEMWWKRLCDATGMTPLVIDAWSGSSICYNYAQNDSTHSDTNKIPMCSAMRTSRLSKDGHNPDIIIIAGGGNDWSYAAAASGTYRATTPIGEWNGHTPVNPTAIDSGDSTFMESYAYMIKRLRANYPNAIIVASTVWRSIGRGSFNPSTPTETSEGLVLLNNVGNSVSDYSEAIAKVCKIMEVPLINVSDIGITRENASTYAPDDPPTHVNPIGQTIIAKRYIEELPRLVKQFK